MRASRIAGGLCVFFLISALGGLVSPAAAASNQLVRVPQDARTLDAAISRVADGGVVEMAAGIYSSPPSGFFLGNLNKGFTVRAAAGAAVAIDGGGSRKLIRYVNSNLARGKLVAFERITFQNGYSADTGFAGGVTLSAAAAQFRNCRFESNRAASALTGGGAVKVIVGSTAVFTGCSFDGNSSNLRGGAMVVRDATATITGGEFTANRTNLPGHDPRSIGGAIAVIDGTLSVTGTRFEANEAGWTGGAIYAIGVWDQAGSNVFVTGATFVANQAVPDPCCTQSESTFGGAIHAEDLTTLRVHDSLFALNRADVGGGLDDYRADVEVDGAVFQANQTTLAKPAGGFGGAISALSADSASDGDVNRRPSRLVITQSLIEGGSGVAQAPVSGGCIVAAGDAGRVYGGKVTPIGTVEENRAQVVIRGVVFSDCDVTASADPGSGLGGALNGTMIDLDLEDSMVLDSDARGTNAGGGALALLEESNARIVRTTFAHDSAQKWGGALFVSGSTLQIDGSRFYADDVVPGVSEGLSDSRGAAIYTIPQMDPAHPRNVGGVVSNSTFSEIPGIPIWDVDPQTGATNEMRYDGNRFYATAFGGLVYVDTLAAPGGDDRRGVEPPHRLPRRAGDDEEERRPQPADLRRPRRGPAGRPLARQRRRGSLRDHRVHPRLCLERQLGHPRRHLRPGAEGRAPPSSARELQPDRRSDPGGGGDGHRRVHGGSLPLPGGQPLPRRGDLAGQRGLGVRAGGVSVGGYRLLLVRRPGQRRAGGQGARRARPQRPLLGLLRRPDQSRLHPDDHRHGERSGQGLLEPGRQVRQRRRHRSLRGDLHRLRGLCRRGDARVRAAPGHQGGVRRGAGEPLPGRRALPGPPLLAGLLRGRRGPGRRCRSRTTPATSGSPRRTTSR